MEKEAFVQEVRSGKVIVDFYADWCGPCRAVEPVVQKLAADKDLKLVKVNIDESRDLAEQYGVSSIPFIALFEDGEVVKTSLGAKPFSVLESSLGLS